MRKLFFLPLFFTISHCFAQEAQVAHQSLYWIRYYNQWDFSNKWTWHNEIDERRFFENNRQFQFIMHSHLHYKLNQNIDFAQGLSYSQQSPSDPNSTKTLVVPEIRPFQTLQITQHLSSRFSLQSRFKFEERFLHRNDGSNLTNGYDFNFRMRYRIQASVILSKMTAKLPLSARVSDEIMINAGSSIIYNYFDQNRFFIGLEQTLSPSVSVEVGYLKLFQQRTSGYQFFDRDIARLTVFHKIINEK